MVFFSKEQNLTESSPLSAKDWESVHMKKLGVRGYMMFLFVLPCPYKEYLKEKQGTQIV